MQRWGVPEAERQGVLKRLVDERFIDDQRYAEAYVREKSRLAGWGERKIAMQLRSKGVSSEIIKSALGQIDGDDMQQRLEQKLSRKLKSIKAETDFELRGKLLRYALSLGYDYDQAKDAVQSVVR
jgi:regulatory protein